MDNKSIKYIPIDFIKATVIGMGPEEFLKNQLLMSPKSVFKGEILTKTIYSYKNLTIKVFENNNRIEFSGSLHTFYNDGKHNHNDFGAERFEKSLRLLLKSLNIEPKNLRILHLEWGFNLKLNVNPNYVIDRLIQHKSVNKTVGIDSKADGKYVQFKHSTMILKVYNKGAQFKLKNNLLRVEIKQTNWSKYRVKGIITLQDFIECDKNQFLSELVKQWNSVVFYDIDNSKTEKYLKYQTSIFWDEIRKFYSNKCFKYHLDKLRCLNQAIGFDTQRRIVQLIMLKGNELQL